MTLSQTPVYLLTGFLGSGKTTLLRSWLQQPELAGAALIINELGEVSLDDRLMPSAVESIGLVANACVCCSGLPGLEQAMEELFWDRLRRKIAPYTALVIETTGLADPVPILESLQENALLRERYRLAGVITTMSVTGGLDVLAHHVEARSQLRVANVVVLTKADRVDQMKYQILYDRVRQMAPQAHVLPSAQASLRAEQVLPLLSFKGLDILAIDCVSGVRPSFPLVIDIGPKVGLENSLPDDAPGRESHHHHHHAEAVFIPKPDRQSRATLWLLVRSLRRQNGARILRIKGLVEVDDGDVVTVQWSMGDDDPEITPYATGDAAKFLANEALGLTVIRESEEGI